MAVVLWTIPLMLFFVAVAVVPILVAARMEQRDAAGVPAGVRGSAGGRTRHGAGAPAVANLRAERVLRAGERARRAA